MDLGLKIASHWGLLRPRSGKSRGVRTREGGRKAGVVRPQPGCAPDGRGGPPAKTFDATTVEEWRRWGWLIAITSLARSRGAGYFTGQSIDGGYVKGLI